MPNIYLRLPSSRCLYFRNRDPKKPLAPNEPVVFSPYRHEAFVLRNSLTNAAAVTQEVNERCFSHQQWTNMLHGRAPSGGKPVVKRDNREYLTFAEVQRLIGKADETARSANEDYLCIKLPSEVEMVDTVRAVTPSWNIDNHGVQELLLAINNEFKRSVLDWFLASFDFCTENGRVLCRTQASVLERYLMRYGIEPTQKEKDNLRRVIDRWLRTEHSDLGSYSCMDMQFMDRQERMMLIDKVVIR